MDLTQFFVRLVENILASIPEIAIMFSTLAYGLSTIRKKTSTFPDIAANTKDALQEAFGSTKDALQVAFSSAKDALMIAFDSTKDSLVLSFDEAKLGLFDTFKQLGTQMTESFLEAKDQMLQIVEDFGTQLAQEINGSLVSMQGELANYHKDLTANLGQSNLLVMENKLFMDTISILLAQDPQKVQNGIATVLSGRLNMTREQLQRVPELLVGNLNALEQALRETVAVSGQKTLDDVMEKMGYARKTQA